MQRIMRQESRNIRERFIGEAARPLRLFLKIVGIRLIGTEGRLGFIWTAFWLLLTIQSNLYMFVRRAGLPLLHVLFDAHRLMLNGNLTQELNSALIRLTAFAVETITPYVLVGTIVKTLERFCVSVESVDRSLGRPCLSAVNNCSLVSIFFTLWTVC